MEQHTDLALQVLHNCRNELYSLFPYLDGAFAALPPAPGEANPMGTDGTRLLFSPKSVISAYAADPAVLRHGYLHLLLHCLFLHPFETNASPLWDLACDMAVEQVISLEKQPRLDVFSEIRSHCLSLLGAKARSAAEILALLEQEFFQQ